MQVTGGDRKQVCAALDVHYIDAGARAAVVTAADPTFAAVLQERTLVVSGVPPYRPGEFYLRELPPIRAVLGGLGDHGQPGLIVVDGYVDLDPDGRPGLGAYVHAEFGVPVIGVAKSAFQPATHAIPVLRGTSTRPLFVTAAGMPRTAAAELVSRMAGSFRLPDALRRVDALARGA
ncbi:MAG TPA: endonuclease V [Streptosporangiaceae bacterium]